MSVTLTLARPLPARARIQTSGADEGNREACGVDREPNSSRLQSCLLADPYAQQRDAPRVGRQVRDHGPLEPGRDDIAHLSDVRGTRSELDVDSDLLPVGDRDQRHRSRSRGAHAEPWGVAHVGLPMRAPTRRAPVTRQSDPTGCHADIRGQDLASHAAHNRSASPRHGVDEPVHLPALGLVKHPKVGAVLPALQIDGPHMDLIRADGGRPGRRHHSRCKRLAHTDEGMKRSRCRPIGRGAEATPRRRS
jgi:hypothetical protein